MPIALALPLLLACAEPSGPPLDDVGPIAFAVGAFGVDGRIGANPFVGRWDRSQGAFVGGLDRVASLTDATATATEFVPGAWHDAVTASGRQGVRVHAVRSASGDYGETLIDVEAPAGTTLLWTGNLRMEPVPLRAADDDVIRADRRRPLLEKVFALEPARVDCAGEAQDYDIQFGAPAAVDVEAPHSLVHWPARLTGPARTLDAGALFLEFGGPARSSVTAPYLKLCGTRRPLDARAELALRIEDGPLLALLDVRCGCEDRRYVLVDLDLGEAVNWSW